MMKGLIFSSVVVLLVVGVSPTTQAGEIGVGIGVRFGLCGEGWCGVFGHLHCRHACPRYAAYYAPQSRQCATPCAQPAASCATERVVGEESQTIILRRKVVEYNWTETGPVVRTGCDPQVSYQSTPSYGRVEVRRGEVVREVPPQPIPEKPIGRLERGPANTRFGVFQEIDKKSPAANERADGGRASNGRPKTATFVSYQEIGRRIDPVEEIAGRRPGVEIGNRRN